MGERAPGTLISASGRAADTFGIYLREVLPQRTQDQKKRSARARGQTRKPVSRCGRFCDCGPKRGIVRAEMHVEGGWLMIRLATAVLFLPLVLSGCVRPSADEIARNAEARDKAKR